MSFSFWELVNGRTALSPDRGHLVLFVQHKHMTLIPFLLISCILLTACVTFLRVNNKLVFITLIFPLNTIEIWNFSLPRAVIQFQTHIQNTEKRHMLSPSKTFCQHYQLKWGAQ